MGDSTEFLHQRMASFETQQRAIIAAQARCEEQNRQIFHDFRDVKADLKLLLAAHERNRGGTRVGMVLLGSFTGILGAAADWAVHHLHWLG